jgi:ribosomal protein S12 methylthiotransferase accessory factor
MTATLAGEGPAAAAVRAALGDTDREVRAVAPAELGGELGVVVAPVGATAFRTAADRARSAGLRWLAVELGGVGGVAVEGVEAAVSGFEPGPRCFDCLRTRVRANLDPGQRESEEAPDRATARFAGALAGRAAVRALAGQPTPAMGGVVELPHAARELLAVPGCDCGDDRDRTVRTGHRERSLEDALDAAERAVDGRVGLVSEVGEAESYPVPYYLASVADTAGFSDVTAGEQAAGVAAGWDEAFMKALGEALERYSAGVYRTAALPRGRAAEAPNAIGLSAFVLPERVDAGGERRFVPGADLSDGSEVLLPAERVQFPYETAAPTITTGLGLGSSGAAALVAGLTEAVERDAATLAWYSTYEPLGLSVEDDGYRTLVRRARSEGLATTATLLTQDVDLPVVAVAVHREGEWPRFALGTDAALDPAAAARSAAAEALQNWVELRGMGETGAREAAGRIGRFAGRPEAAREFLDPETTVPVDSVGRSVPPDGRLEAVLGALGDAGLDAYAARLTTPDVAELGFEAVRALVPAAQPLFFDEPYFGERARTVPESLGYEPRLRREHHPFP